MPTGNNSPTRKAVGTSVDFMECRDRLTLPIHLSSANLHAPPASVNQSQDTMHDIGAVRSESES